MNCHATACPREATTSWSRHATPGELRAAAADPYVPSVQPGDTDALITVEACDVHTFPMVTDAEGIERPSDRSAIVHDPECGAPPPDDCHCEVP